MLLSRVRLAAGVALAALALLAGACGGSSCPVGHVERDVCTVCGVTGACAVRETCAQVCAEHADCASLNLPCVDGVCQVMCR